MRKRSTNVGSAVRDEIWHSALKEVDLRRLTGPNSHEDLVQELGPLYVASRRFGLKQTDKIRAIDDFSESMVNAAFGSSHTK